MIEKIKTGIRNPRKIPPYLIANAVPSGMLEDAIDMVPNWKKEEDIYTFREGGFAGGTKNRPEFSARNYYEISQIRDILGKYEISVSKSAEIGSGYGRISPWLTQFSTDHYGIEPNEDAINQARKLYPQITWENKKIQDINSRENEFELIVTWTVLQHIPPHTIQEVADNINNLLSSDGWLLICEETKGNPGTHTWPRDIEEYKELFDELKLIETQTRQLEPTYQSHGGDVLLFRKE